MQQPHRPRLAALGLAPLLASAAVAVPQLYSKEPVLHAHPTGAMPGEAAVVVTGQLTDDVHPDVAVLQGSNLALLYAAARHDVFLVTPGSFEALALAPGAGAGGIDALLTVDAGGLKLFEWNGSALARNAGFPTQSAWIGARDLQVVDHGPALWVAALDAAGTSILRGTWDGSTFTAGPPFAVSGTALSYAILEFDAQRPGAEIAVDSGGGLYVYDAAGARLYDFTNFDSTPIVRRLVEPGGEEAIVWSTALPGGGPGDGMLGVVRNGPSGAYHENFLPLPGYRASDLALGDWFGNGWPDLLSLSQGDDQARVFANQWAESSSPAYSFYLPAQGQTFQIDASDVHVGGSERPAMGGGDLDGDGDMELVLAGHQIGSRSLGVYLADGVDETLLAPQLSQCTDTYSETETATEVQVELGFLVDGPAAQTSATHLRVALWVQPDAQSPVPAVAAFTGTYPIPPSSQSLDVSATFDLPLQSAGQIYHVQLWGEDHTGGSVARAFPATTWWKPRADISEDPMCMGDPGGTGGYNEPPNIQPGGGGARPTP